jgi:MSHA biogenesis protein MshK
MASRATRILPKRGALALAFWALLAAGIARGEGSGADRGLPDPTRPADARDYGAAGGAPSGPVLQSVLISPERRVAVIDGQAVPLGGRYGAATVTAVTETAVVLKEGGRTRQLRMFPSAEKGAAVPDRGGRAKDKP